jgi:hypothetical protein
MHLLNCLKLAPLPLLFLGCGHTFYSVHSIDPYGLLLRCCSMVLDNGAPEAPHAGATGSAMSSEMAVSPSSAASSNHAPFTPSDIPGMTMDVSALDSAFGCDVGNPESLQLGPDGSSRDSIRSLGQLWNFSLSDLTADLTSLGGNLLG